MTILYATCSGRLCSLSHPTPAEVDFVDIAQALSQLNRYAGNSLVPISVAHHTLIGLAECPEELKPWWLLHDAHEQRICEVTTPAKRALETTAEEIAAEVSPHTAWAPGVAAALVSRTLARLTARHDAAIHTAAGLPLPSASQKAAIRQIDLICLATERRDFHAPPSAAWDIDEMDPPPRAARRVHKWRAPARCAEELLAAFERYLPALVAANAP